MSEDMVKGMKKMNSAARIIIEKNLKNAVGVPAVLLSTGSYNPPHTEHVNILCRAKEKLSEHDLNVIGCLVSPSHDLYVKGKLRDQAISGVDRHKMMQLTIKDLGMKDVFADTWELDRRGFVDHPEVIRRLKERLKGINDKVQLWYVCGSDLFNNCCGREKDGHGADGIVVCNRGGISSSKVPHILVDQHVDISSTQIRFAGDNAKELQKYMTPSTIEYYLSLREKSKNAKTTTEQ
eukprot:TRINITY_DN19141_c0_g1_i1.p1 TRINITY_DN19141_c0_g1~~TRINITY_DN19141_c0_g1_i1.p1  ORF type:complete len:236 (+),score=25.55 TRINITY_DN19141_c0_g1_i1:47-754(+)